VAEDEEDIARLLAETLGAELDVDVTIVSNGALVPDAVAEQRARLLVLDINLPGASGIDVYDLVRNHPAIAGVPVLFVTANPELADGALPGPAPREVIAKPFDVAALVERARALLSEAVGV
jgi:DNA-binding response OmpR family regulator